MLLSGQVALLLIPSPPSILLAPSIYFMGRLRFLIRSCHTQGLAREATTVLELTLPINFIYTWHMPDDDFSIVLW